MFTAIVVDDEKLAGELLSNRLTESGQVVVKYILQNPLQLMDIVQQEDIDAVFLDIGMPQMTGLELAKKLNSMARPPVIVFVTAYKHYAFEAFRVNALDYLLKPVQSKELQRAIDKIILSKATKY